MIGKPVSGGHNAATLAIIAFLTLMVATDSIKTSPT
jgi:hypothetical protein